MENAPEQKTEPKRIAIIATVWRYLSHAQHMGDRFLVGYPWEGRWHRPPLKVVSAYVDQRGVGDQSAERAAEFGFHLAPTIAEALRCGGPQLAVDGVVVIGEHGNYPVNELGQVQYPRYEFFKQIAAVFEADGRSVPVFNDKHLSYSFDKAREMVETSRRLSFPMLAGSSLPVTWRLPAVDVPHGADLAEAMVVGAGPADVIGFHGLEALQCLVERRRGGETGVRAVQMIDGGDVWRAGDAGRWSWKLLAAALSRTDTRVGLGVGDGRPNELIESGELKCLCKNPAAYSIEYRDGFRATLLLLDGALGDFVGAWRLRGKSTPVSTQFLLPPKPNVAYSACLMRAVEELIVTGKAPYPVERTLLTSGTLEACLRSRHAGGKRLETLQLDISYRSPKEARFGSE